MHGHEEINLPLPTFFMHRATVVTTRMRMARFRVPNHRPRECHWPLRHQVSAVRRIAGTDVEASTADDLTWLHLYESTKTKSLGPMPCHGANEVSNPASDNSFLNLFAASGGGASALIPI
jgi:hypothetical protein